MCNPTADKSLNCSFPNITVRLTISQGKFLKHYTSMTHESKKCFHMPKWRYICNDAALTRQRVASWWNQWRCLCCGWLPRETSRQTDLPLCLPAVLKKKTRKTTMSHTKCAARLGEIRIHTENYSLLSEPERKLLSRLPCIFSEHYYQAERHNCLIY